MNIKILAFAFLFCAMMVSCNNGNREETATLLPALEMRSDSVTLSEQYSAVIEGRQDVEIFPQIEGKITRVCVKEGQEVKAGQLLFVIDQVPYCAALRMAEADVHAARSQVKTARLERDGKQALYSENVISDYDLQTAQNNLSAAEAALEQALAREVNARNNLSYTEIKSPSDGMTGTLPYKAGALVSPQIAQPLTTVSDNGEMFVYFSISEKQLQEWFRQHGSMESAISNLPEVSLLLSNRSLYEYKGRIEAISGVVNRQTGTAQVKAVFPNTKRILLSGSIGNVVMPHTAKDVIIIPQSATYEIQDKVYCMKVVDGKAEATEIQVDRINDGLRYIVRSGLSAGDVIISEGTGTVKDGQEVSVEVKKGDTK